MSGKIKEKNILKEEIKDVNKNDELKDNKLNKKYNIKLKKIFQTRNNILKKILFIMIYYLFIKIFYKSEPLLIKSANITLVINGIGEKNIFSHECNGTYPNEIYINDINQTSITYKYIFNQTNNIIELLWNHNNIDCGYMFKGCSGLNEIDLSNFNSSNCLYMYGIFERCSSLTSLNLSNFDTSHVEIMNSMFDNCTSLKSLNLSSFDTSQLTKISFMFLGCLSLTSVDLSNFNISKVVSIGKLFLDCKNLRYINLKGFVETVTTEVIEFLKECLIMLLFV